MMFADVARLRSRRQDRIKRVRSGKAVMASRATWLAAGLLLAGCAQPITDIGSSSTTRMVPTETAFAMPDPGGPAVTAVLEQHFANATQQDIMLGTSAHTPGQNLLRVQLYGPVNTAQAGESRLRDGFLPIRDVGSEMRTLLPGIRMERSAFYVQNRYGPFGYAVGRAPSGDLCLYGWQRITSTGATQTLIGNKGSVQIRLRLCDQHASEAQLLQTMYGYTITASFKSRNWNPYGSVMAPEKGIGQAGNPIYPVGVSKFETVVPQAAPQSRPREVRRPVQQPRSVEVAPPRLPEPIGPTVPPPPGKAGLSAQPVVPLAPTVSVPSPATVQKAPAKQVVVPPPPCLTTGEAKGCNQGVTVQ